MAAAVLQFVSFNKETKLGDEIELKLYPVNISGVLKYSRSEECLFKISNFPKFFDLFTQDLLENESKESSGKKNMKYR